MDGPNYAIFRIDGPDRYRLNFEDTDPYYEEEIESYDEMLHQTLSQIFRERCLSHDQTKELLRATDQDSLIKLVLEVEPAHSQIFTAENKLPLLWIAVLLGYHNSAELLVRSGADVTERCGTKFDGFIDESWTILHVLLAMYPSEWSHEFIGLVIDHGADLEARDSDGCTALYFAARTGRVEVAKMLLEKGSDVNAAANDGTTPLLAAVCSSNADEKMSLLLMYRGADVTTRHLEARDSDGCTLLHLAARTDQVEVAEMLLEKGADVDAFANDGKTPMLTAVCNSADNDLFVLLMDHGADFSVRDAEGRNALHHLACAPVERANQAKAFIEMGASVDDVDDLGQYQPLHLAAREGKLLLVNLFLDYGAKINAQAEDGIFPLYLAAQCNNNGQLLFTLLERGADIDLKTISKGRTAMHIACYRAQDLKAVVLGYFGADIDVEDHDGNTPLSLMYTADPSKSRTKEMLMMLAQKKTYQQPSIELKDERLIGEDPTQWRFYQECIEEIVRMKSTRFIETCTFFELITKCYCQLGALMRHREFEKKFRQYDLKAFPKHAKDISLAIQGSKNYYEAMLENEDLIDEAVYSTWSHIIVRKVARYMIDCGECKIRKTVRASRSSSCNSGSMPFR